MNTSPSITRRNLLLASTAALLPSCTPTREYSPDLAAHPSEIKDYPPNLKITRIQSFNLPLKRPKFIGRNSQRNNHGDHTVEYMVRIHTNAGIDGLGFSKAPRENWTKLIGKNPFHFYQQQKNGFVSPIGTHTMALWDLAGKALNKPVYQLLGGKGTKLVPVYDGSIYFSEMVPLYAQQGLDRFKVEIDQGRAAGHRAFKIKIGRGYKWMEKNAGYQMDLAVLKTIRRHAGPKIKLGVDANNGYDLEQTKRLLNDIPDFNFEFMEEMFPESIKQYRELKVFMTERNHKTLIADGESRQRPDDLKPFIDAKAIDIFQGDMRNFGFEGILTEAQLCKAAGLRVAPHNWGSLFGFYMQLHVGRAINNFYMAEHDPLTSDLLIADGYNIKDGKCTVPDAPGFGLTLDETRFSNILKPIFDLQI
ncbi:MAG: mandelate racemase/muconate lactonizing enzyme family protein [Planctomycetota bacterium]|nr:MAG: mandelate racemase/muconate lactonizing enzyme family protein [Planctomycetota bacterium]